jgi:hypothetical protein
MNRGIWPANGREETRIKIMNVEAFPAMKGAKQN